MKNKTMIYYSLFFVFIFGAITPMLFWQYGNNYIYYIRPIIWVFILGIIYLFTFNRKKTFSFKTKDVREFTLISVLVYVIIYYSIGIVIGYTKSGFDRSILGLVKNSWWILSFFVPREIVRNYFVKNTNYKNRKIIYILITIIMIFSDVSYNNFSASIQSFSTFIEYFIKTFMPLAALNIFLTYLAVKDGYVSSLIYILIIKLVSIITPIFPNNIFFILVIIDYLTPLFAYINIEKIFSKYKRLGLPLFDDTKVKIKRLLLVLLLIVLLCFSTRLLPFMPTVIVSNSMYPNIRRGDMVIIIKKNYNSVKINDIIEYKKNNIYVVHRIINVKNTNKGLVYTTKGDNNLKKDSDPVYEDQITGKVIFNIPKVGYPTIIFREFLEQFRGIKVEEGVR